LVCSGFTFPDATLDRIKEVEEKLAGESDKK
jgi:hypothetical protein